MSLDPRNLKSWKACMLLFPKHRWLCMGLLSWLLASRAPGEAFRCWHVGALGLLSRTFEVSPRSCIFGQSGAFYVRHLPCFVGEVEFFPKWCWVCLSERDSQAELFNFDWYHCVQPIGQFERSLSYRQMWGGSVRLYDAPEFICPCPIHFAKSFL